VSLRVSIKGPKYNPRRLFGFFGDAKATKWRDCLPDPDTVDEEGPTLCCGSNCGYRVRLASHLHHFKHKLLCVTSGYLRARLPIGGGTGAPVAPPSPADLLRVTSDAPWKVFVDQWQRQVLRVLWCNVVGVGALPYPSSPPVTLEASVPCRCVQTSALLNATDAYAVNEANLFEDDSDSGG